MRICLTIVSSADCIFQRSKLNRVLLSSLSLWCIQESDVYAGLKDFQTIVNFGLRVLCAQIRVGSNVNSQK